MNINDTYCVPSRANKKGPGRKKGKWRKIEFFEKLTKYLSGVGTPYSAQLPKGTTTFFHHFYRKKNILFIPKLWAKFWTYWKLLFWKNYDRRPSKVLYHFLKTGKRVDKITGDVYHTTFHPPSAADVAKRLETDPSCTEGMMVKRLAEYHRNIEGVLRCYQQVSLNKKVKQW